MGSFPTSGSINSFGYPVGGGDLYVDPDSGLLQVMSQHEKRKSGPRELPYELVDHPDDPSAKFALLAGIWYQVRIVKAEHSMNFGTGAGVTDKTVWRAFFPLWLPEDVTPEEFAREVSSRTMWHIDDDVVLFKQQLNGEEIARFVRAHAA